MEMRVEHLAARSGVSVDTVRYYQSKGLLDPPRREGRIAWYDDTHLARLTRIRALQERGFTLATIARLVSGELDAADEALLGELSGLPHSVPDGTPGDGTPGDGGAGAEGTDGTVPGEPRTYTLAELATETGIPLALLKAVEAEQLLIPRRVAGLERYTDEDVAAASAALLLLEWGIPLPALLDLARLHHEATETVARERSTCSRASSATRSARVAIRAPTCVRRQTPTAPRRARRSSGCCRPTPSSSRRSTAWSDITSPAR